MHEVSESDARQLKNRIMITLDDLPPMHEVVMKAQEIMADPGSDIEDLVAIIETDQSIAVRILKLINSAHYGLSGKVSSIRQACSLLGLRTLQEVIITVGVSKVLVKSPFLEPVSVHLIFHVLKPLVYAFLTIYPGRPKSALFSV